MKHLFVICWLLCWASAWGAENASETPEETRAKIGDLTKQIDGWKKQVGDFGNASTEKQAVIFELTIGYVTRAQAYEKIGNWKDAAWDWYLADDARQKLVLPRYANMIAREADFRASQAGDQLKAGDLEGAARSMRAAREGKGWNERLSLQLLIGANINLLLNRPDQALADALDAKGRTQNPRDAYVALSLANYQKGDLEKARANWAEVLKIEPKYAPVQLFDPAAVTLHAKIAQTPKDAQAWLKRGYYYYSAGTSYGSPKFKDDQQPGSWFCQPVGFNQFTTSRSNFLNAAQRDYTQSQKLSPNAHTLALRAQALYELSKTPTEEKAGFFAPESTWLEDVKQARQTGYDNFDAMAALGYVYKLVARDYEKARKPSEARSAQVQTNLYESLAVLHRPENVLAKSYRESLARAADQLIAQTQNKATAPALTLKTAEEWKKAGNQALSDGNLALALQRYQQALVIDPSYADAQTNLGSIYIEVGDYPRGLAAYRAAIALEPQHRLVHGNLADKLLMLNFPKEALEEADQAVKAAPTPDLKAWALDIRIAIRVKTGDLAGAMADLRTQTELDPKAAKPWQLIGKLALFDAEIDTAKEALMKADELEPDNGFTRTFLAMAVNAAAVQSVAQTQGKSLRDLKSAELERIYPAAQELLKGLRLTKKNKTELIDFWNDWLGRFPLGKRDHYSLRLSCQAVLPSVADPKPSQLTFEGTRQN